MGQCLAPCVKDVPKDAYKEMIQEITDFLNGGHEHVKKELEEKMYKASEALDFERAKELVRSNCEYRSKLWRNKKLRRRRTLRIVIFWFCSG